MYEIPIHNLPTCPVHNPPVRPPRSSACPAAWCFPCVLGECARVCATAGGKGEAKMRQIKALGGASRTGSLVCESVRVRVFARVYSRACVRACVWARARGSPAFTQAKQHAVQVPATNLKLDQCTFFRSAELLPPRWSFCLDFTTQAHFLCHQQPPCNVWCTDRWAEAVDLESNALDKRAAI